MKGRLYVYCFLIQHSLCRPLIDKTGSDSEEEPLVVDDIDSTPPPCITIGEDDGQQPIQIRVAVQGRILG